MTGLLPDDAVPELLWTGGEWLEGPAWIAATGRLRFSDIPNDRILEYDAVSGETSVYATGVEYVNGRTIDADGSVVQCSHGRRRIERDAGGTVTAIAGEWAGGRFNSPNDVVVASDGSIWFSDPPYGLHPSGREGHPGEQDYDGCYVFRFSAGRAEPVITDMVHPNGLAFSPDESVLYVADTGFYRDGGGPCQLRAYDVAGGVATNGRLFADMTGGASDGFRVDADGNVWTSAGAALCVFAPDGAELLRLPFPETVSNLCFAGTDLYVTASASLYRLPTHARGPRASGSSTPSSIS